VGDVESGSIRLSFNPQLRVEFRGKWNTRFPKRQPATASYTLSGKAIGGVPLMSQQRPFRYLCE